jgi:hypothetical protein
MVQESGAASECMKAGLLGRRLGRRRQEVRYFFDTFRKI